MDFITWKDDYATGIYNIDQQHRYLVVLLNNIIKFHNVGENSYSKLFYILNGLVSYAEDHFRDEEVLMQELRYPKYQDHKNEHEYLVQEIFKINENLLERNDEERTKRLLMFLQGWLLEHIIGLDKELGVYYMKTKNVTPAMVDLAKV